MKLSLSLIGYVAAVVLANVLTNQFGLINAGFGLLVTAGTYAAGLALLTRDFVHRLGNVGWVLGAIVVAGVLSWVTSSPGLAIASTLAFFAGELVDLFVYVPVEKRYGFAPAALASAIAAAPVDTYLFLLIAGFSITADALTGQFLVKVVWVTLIPLLALRVVLRKPVF